METIQISKQTWEELKKNPTYSELIEEIEEREAIFTSREENKGKKLKSWKDFKKENPLS